MVQVFGSHLCKRLVKENNNVICVDNLETGSLENIEHLLTSKNFKFIEQDIINEFDFKSPIDEIFNLACPASPINYQKDPVRTNKTSVIGILNLLDLALKKDAKIFHASTSEIYGNQQFIPSLNLIGVMLILLAQEHVMTKVKDALRHFV